MTSATGNLQQYSFPFLGPCRVTIPKTRSQGTLSSSEDPGNKVARHWQREARQEKICQRKLGFVDVSVSSSIAQNSLQTL